MAELMTALNDEQPYVVTSPRQQCTTGASLIFYLTRPKTAGLQKWIVTSPGQANG